MPKSPVKTKTDNDWNAKAYWFPRIFFPKSEEPRIREAASKYPSINAFFREAVNEKIERMDENGI